MTTTSSGVKVCCECGKDLSKGQRIKDSEGRYWCPSCDETDKWMRKRGFTIDKKKTTEASSEPSNRGKMVKMLVIVGLLAVAAIVINFVL